MRLVETPPGKMDGRRRLSDIEPLLELLGVVVFADAAAWSRLGARGHKAECEMLYCHVHDDKGIKRCRYPKSRAVGVGIGARAWA